LVHLPSGVAFTGRPDEDKFIGSPAVWMDSRTENLETTAALDSLVLTWKEGKAFGQEKIPYASITGIDFGKRKESEIISNEAAFIGGGLVGIAASALTHVQTLIVETREGNYELYLSQASDWAERLRREMGLPTPEQAPRGMKQCRSCGAWIPLASETCRCGASLDS
jgi:hypothetical protein